MLMLWRDLAGLTRRPTSRIAAGWLFRVCVDTDSFLVFRILSNCSILSFLSFSSSFISNIWSSKYFLSAVVSAFALVKSSSDSFSNNDLTLTSSVLISMMSCVTRLLGGQGRHRVPLHVRQRGQTGVGVGAAIRLVAVLLCQQQTFQKRLKVLFLPHPRQLCCI